MAFPVAGYRVTTGYRKPGNWISGFHPGVDVAAPSGRPVVAARGGVVMHVGWSGWGNSYGVQVIIDQQGGTRTAYCHLSRTTVRVGQAVSAGQQIGNVGTTGNSTGPHLHMESRTPPFGYNNRIVDPQQFFAAVSAPAASGGGVYLGKLRRGQTDSDSVRVLQRALNAHSLPAPGNITLPITGNFGEKTALVVVTCQRVHHFGNDPLGSASVGPRQAAHLGLRAVG